MSNPADRRIQERISARLEVRFKDKAEAARAFRAYSLNFSSGGLCLRTRRSYAIGATLHLSLAVEGEAFELSGEVAWVRGEAIGVRFLDVDEKLRARLAVVAEALKSKRQKP